MGLRRTIAGIAVAGAALPGCGALLDLDVQYVDASDEGGIGPDVSPTDAAENVDASDASDAGDGFDGAPPPPPVYVQGANINVPDSNSASLQFDQSVAAHDTIIVAVDFGTMPGLTIKDSLGDGFTEANLVSNSGLSCSIWYAVDVAAGDDTLTVTTPRSTTFELYIHEYSGIVAFEGQAGAIGMGALMESGFITTSQPNDLVFGYGVTGAASVGTGFMARLTLNSNITEDKIAVVPGSYEATANSTANAGWTMLMAAFRAR